MSPEFFRCRRCGSCCRWPGAVRVNDAEADAIARFLGCSVTDFLERHTRLTPDRQHLSLTEKNDGSCFFLEEGEEASCRIDLVKPVQCRDFPEKWNFPDWERYCQGEKRFDMFKRSGNLIVVSGPSGVGKSTLVNRVRAAMPELEFSISCTTRTPRAGETNGKDYYFLTPEEFERRSAAGDFLEQAHVFNHRYGTLKSEVLDRIRKGGQVVLDIDVQGALQIRKAAEEDPEIRKAAHFILIAPPSLDTLEKRLRGRNSESEEQLQLRLAGARRELSFFRSYDYMLVNDEIESAAVKLSSVLRSFRLLTANLKGDPFQ